MLYVPIIVVLQEEEEVSDSSRLRQIIDQTLVLSVFVFGVRLL